MIKNKNGYRLYMICQSEEFERSLFEFTRNTGLQLVGNQSDIQMALWEIKTLSPDIIIMDFDNNGVDAFEICERIKREITPDIHYIIVTDECSFDRFESAYALGISYCMMRPFDMDILIEKLSTLTEHIDFSRNQPLMQNHIISAEEKSVEDILFRIGVPEHCKGYALLKSAILCVIHDSALTNKVMGALYPAIAKMHNTTVSCTERNIRNVIQIIWNRGNIEYLADIFGNTIRSKKGTPSNSHFIATIADLVKCNKQ